MYFRTFSEEAKNLFLRYFSITTAETFIIKICLMSVGKVGCNPHICRAQVLHIPLVSEHRF